MNLLDRLEAVRIKADNRISAEDKAFCEQHQAAYEAALQAFHELMFFWEDMEKAQTELLDGATSTKNPCAKYLVSSSGLEISTRKIQKHMEELHTTFIYTIVDYFNATYSTTLSARNAIEKLLPPKPDYSCLEKKLIEDYHKKMISLTICYEDVVEILITQLDGRSFTEQAFHELAAKCHFAAWNIYQKKPEFVRQKNIIRFSENGCRVRNRSHCDRWELCDSLKNVLRGAAHFETKCFRVYPLGFPELLGHTGVYDNEQEFPTCEKLRSLKMFKNGRVDLKFSTENFAEAFVRDYLGLVC